MSARIAPRIAPPDAVDAVEEYVSSELNDARSFVNRELFDDSGVWSLHALAASIYAMGWRDGERAEQTRDRGERARRRAAQATQ